MKILVVDDSVSVRMHVVDICEEANHTTYQAGNGLEALEILRKEPVDIVLTDINMPEMNGIELLEAMQKEDINTTTIAITTNVSPSTMQRAKQLGMKGWMIKPIKEDVFLTLLNKISESL